jgi:hypothetical protein
MAARLLGWLRVRALTGIEGVPDFLKRGRAVLLILVVISLQACDSGTVELPETWAGRDRVTFTHPSGLEIELPEGVYEVEETATGFRIRPKGAAQMRSPFLIHVKRATGARPNGAWPQSRRLRERDFRYRVDDSKEGGSGGEEHLLQAWESQADAHLMLEQMVQVEFPMRPDFTDGWAILAFARLR